MARKIKLAVLGSTRGTDLQAIIDAIESNELDAEIVLVASDKKDAFILERAAKHKIPTFSVDYKQFKERLDAEKLLLAELKRKGAELILLIGFMKILTPYFVGEFRRRIWNIHPSLLPKYAGGMDLDVHAQVLGNHEKETGCTLHEVTEELDGGRTIMQKRCQIAPGETPETLKEKVQRLEQECLLEAIKMVSEGRIVIGSGK
jgi:formyltetrahydrofolate-dependent phosphoribosylglycinamide formyltransferase